MGDFVQNLLAWLAAQDDFPEPLLEIAEFPTTGRGLRAKRNITEGELMLSIPTNFLLNTQSAKASERLGPLLAKATLTPVQIMCLHLLSEKNHPHSFWTPYLSSLPTDFDCALNFSDDDIAALGHAEKAKEVKEMKARVHGLYDSAIEQLSLLAPLAATAGLSDVTFAAFAWAWVTIMTRGMFMRGGGDGVVGDIATLVPMADFFNHANVKTKAAFDVGKGCYDFYAACDWAAGEEVFICYGTFSNWALMRDYGFILPDNRVDGMAIDPTAPHFCVKDSLAEAKEAFIADNNLLQGWEISASEDEPVSYSMMAALRVRNAEQKDTKCLFRAVSGEAFSVEGDVKVWKMILAHCKRKLEDMQAAKDQGDTTSYRRTMIVAQRRQAMSLLASVISKAEAALS